MPNQPKNDAPLMILFYGAAFAFSIGCLYGVYRLGQYIGQQLGLW